MMKRMMDHSWLAIVAACVSSVGCGQYNDGFDGDDLEGADISEIDVSGCKNTLAGGERLNAGQYRCSLNGDYRFGVGSNGNLELLAGSTRLWSAAISGSGNFAAMQRDGNLVVRNSKDAALWDSRTAGKSGAMLTVENDGRAVIRHNASIVWSVGEGGGGGGGGGTQDLCPNDPNKTQPGQCGCGVPEGTCSTGQKVRFFVVGDTQKINNEDPGRYSELLNRLPQQSTKMGVNFVFQAGDNTEDGVTSNWERARTGWQKLDGVIPYVLNVGNNDRMNGNRFSTYFPLNRYKAWDSFVSNYENHDNVAHEFNAGGTRWLAISLRFSDNASWKGWAEGLIQGHPKHNVIIINHDENGSAAAATLANANDNVKFIFAGHTGTSHSGQVKTNKFGHKWVWYKHCWHSKAKDEYFALIEVDVNTGVVKGKYYSPYQGKYWSDPSAALYSQRPSWDNWTWSGVTFVK